jgi:hypothetical protein
VERSLREALEEVTAWFQERGVEHAVAGSSLLFLLGLEVPVHDLDLMLPASARPALAAAPWSRLDPPPPSPLFSSDWLERFVVGGAVVECIGGIRFRFGDRLVALPMAGGGRASVGGRSVPLAPAAVWYHVYRVYRPEHAAALGSVLDAAAIAAAAEELGLPPSAG